MTNNIITKYMNLLPSGTALTVETNTEEVSLSNFKYVDFVVSISSGTEVEAAITTKARKDDVGISQAVAFRRKLADGVSYEAVPMTGLKVMIGGTANNPLVLRVSADNLAKGEFDRVSLSIGLAVASTDLTVSVIAVLYEPRYTDQSC